MNLHIYTKNVLYSDKYQSAFLPHCLLQEHDKSKNVNDHHSPFLILVLQFFFVIVANIWLLISLFVFQFSRFIYSHKWLDT